MLNDKYQMTKAVILAGGERTKLLPLNNYCPTWMFPVFNRPLIAYTIDFLKKNGFEEIIITLSEKEKIPDFLKRTKVSGINIKYHKEDRPRGTAGVLKDVERFIGKEPFLVINSNLFVGRIDLSNFIKFHLKTGSIATVGVYR